MAAVFLNEDQREWKLLPVLIETCLQILVLETGWTGRNAPVSDGERPSVKRQLV